MLTRHSKAYKAAQRVMNLEASYRMYQLTNVPTDPEERVKLDLWRQNLERGLAAARAAYNAILERPSTHKET